jgi:hypothetical protein
VLTTAMLGHESKEYEIKNFGEYGNMVWFKK